MRTTVSFESTRFSTYSTAFMLLAVLSFSGCQTGYVMNQSGRGYYRSGQYAMAAKEFQTAVAQEPHNADYRANLAMALEKSGDATGAEKAYREALTVSPAHQASTHGLAQLMIDNNRQPEAVELMQSYVGLADYKPEAHLEMAWLQEKIGNQAGAQEAIQTALKRAPNNPAIMTRLGESYEKTGNTTAAVKVYQKALQANIGQPELQTRIARLTGDTPNNVRVTAAKTNQLKSAQRYQARVAQQQLRQQSQITAQLEQQVAAANRRQQALAAQQQQAIQRQQIAQRNQQIASQKALQQQAYNDQMMQLARQKQAYSIALQQQAQQQTALRQQIRQRNQIAQQQYARQQFAQQQAVVAQQAQQRQFAMQQAEQQRQMQLAMAQTRVVMPQQRVVMYPPQHTQIPSLYGQYGPASAGASPHCASCNVAGNPVPQGMIPVGPTITSVPQAPRYGATLPAPQFGYPANHFSSPPPIPVVPSFDSYGSPTTMLQPEVIDSAELPPVATPTRVADSIPEVKAF